jgi:hypothetical protein
MRKLISALSLAGVIALSFGQDRANAQTPAGGGTAPPSTGGLSRKADVTPIEQVAQASAATAEMEGIRARVQGDLERARKERDVVKTLCLNDKLNQIDVAIQSAAERRHGLELAAKRGDTDLANHEYTILSVLHQRVQQLDTEANQCIGKEVAFTGESSVTVNHEGELPVEDPSEFPPTPVVVQPPSCASCFR